MKTDNINPSLTDTNQALVGTLTGDELILFDFLKKSVLEIFPQNLLLDKDGTLILEGGKPVYLDTFPKETLELAESFAFKATTGISEYINSKLANYHAIING